MGQQQSFKWADHLNPPLPLWFSLFITSVETSPLMMGREKKVEPTPKKKRASLFLVFKLVSNSS